MSIMTGPANPDLHRNLRNHIRSKWRQRESSSTSSSNNLVQSSPSQSSPSPSSFQPLSSATDTSTGVDAEHVLAEKSHLDELKCGLCNKLVSLDAYSTIPCAHPFCRGCFENWLDSKPPKSTCVCPSCGIVVSDVPGAPTAIKPDSLTHYKGHRIAARPMSQAQPLAHRILKKVKVLCPHRNKRSCTWTGDYRDLKAHVATHLNNNNNNNNNHSNSSNERGGNCNGHNGLHNHSGCGSGECGGGSAGPSVSSRSPQLLTRKNSSDSMERRSRSSTRDPSSSKSMNARSRQSPASSRQTRPPNRRSSLEIQSPKRELRRVQSMMVGDRGRGSHSSSSNRHARSRSPIRPQPPDKLSQSLPPRSGAPSPADETLDESSFNNSSSNNGSSNGRRSSINHDDPLVRRTKSLHDIDNPATTRSSPTPPTNVSGSGGPGHASPSHLSPTGRASPMISGHSSTHSSSTTNSSSMQPPPRRRDSVTRRRSNRRPSFLSFAYAMKEKANAAFKSGRYEEAADIYSEAIHAFAKRGNDEEDELAATLFSNRAASFLRMNRYELCIKDCDCAIGLNPYLMKVSVCAS